MDDNNTVLSTTNKSKITSATSKTTKNTVSSKYLLPKDSTNVSKQTAPQSAYTVSSTNTQDSNISGKRKKKNKHVIDKVGPFAQKGREDTNLIMVGNNGLGIFAKKTNPLVINNTKKDTLSERQSGPTLQDVIKHPKSA